MHPSLCLLTLALLVANPVLSIPDGFTFVGHLNSSTPIITKLRYAGKCNFVGRVVQGYERIPSKGAILTLEAARALLAAQERFVKDGFKMVVYDTYRPTRAVSEFVEWAEDGGVHEEMKQFFYPRVDKKDLFDLGYIARSSGHSRGSTVDVSIIKINEEPYPEPVVVWKELLNNFTTPYLEDGTIDMGSSWDMLDELSHFDNELLLPEHKNNRAYLKMVMESCGFYSYDKEWWHFRLQDEPFPDTYFDFDMADSTPSSTSVTPTPSLAIPSAGRPMQIYISIMHALLLVIITSNK